MLSSLDGTKSRSVSFSTIPRETMEMDCDLGEVSTKQRVCRDDQGLSRRTTL